MLSRMTRVLVPGRSSTVPSGESMERTIGMASSAGWCARL
jgi:hypothetical protein